MLVNLTRDRWRNLSRRVRERHRSEVPQQISRSASDGCTPREDLIESLADRHARRHKRAGVTLVGGSVVAIALVFTLIATVFNGSAGNPVKRAGA